MTGLQWLGITAALVSMAGFYTLYRRRGGKTPIVLGGAFSLGLLVVALEPDILNGIIGFVVDADRRNARLLMLLTVGVIVLTVLLIRTLFLTDYHERALREVVVQRGIQRFEERYGPDALKPVQVIVPAFNEAANLRRLLPTVPETVGGREVGVLVVSDGSRDGTVEVAREHGCPAVENLINLGQGVALRLGFEICARGASEVVVTMDADGQHDPSELADLVEPILQGEADFTVGSRRLGKDHRSPLLRRLGTRLFNGVLSLLLWRRITDVSSGFRAVRRRLLSTVEFSEPRYLEPQFLIQAITEGARYREVPVTISPRWEGSSKKPADLRYGWGFFGVILRSWWRQ